uniref:Insulin-like domain-containing protein n=1 Tax=Hippocampus comes TaxID=109280 RepID=A0A3Q2XG24_HIPCM
MRSGLPMAILLCVVCAAQGQVPANANALRLCGRALLRAVVFTCGGSRWRRLTGDALTLQSSDRGHPNFKTTDAVPMMARYRRDQDQALVAACCQRGCQRSDLSLLC